MEHVFTALLMGFSPQILKELHLLRAFNQHLDFLVVSCVQGFLQDHNGKLTNKPVSFIISEKRIWNTSSNCSAVNALILIDFLILISFSDFSRLLLFSIALIRWIYNQKNYLFLYN